MTHSKYNTRRPYRIGDATAAFIAANPCPPEHRNHRAVPWTLPTEDLGALPSASDQTATAVL